MCTSYPYDTGMLDQPSCQYTCPKFLSQSLRPPYGATRYLLYIVLYFGISFSTIFIAFVIASGMEIRILLLRGARNHLLLQTRLYL